jgi:hypothetical protein
MLPRQVFQYLAVDPFQVHLCRLCSVGPGARVRLRATADDGAALEGDFVVARASGAWVAVRRVTR